MVSYKLVSDIEENIDNYISAFKMECSSEDIKHDKDAKRLARKINRECSILKTVNKLLKKFENVN